MSKYQITRFNRNKNIVTISSQKGFERNLELFLSLRGEQAIENFEWAYIDLNYYLFDCFVERKRVILSYQDFLDPYSLNINTGEFLFRIQIGAFFVSKNPMYSINADLIIRNQPGIPASLRMDKIHEAIIFGPTVEFLEIFRSMSDENFLQIINTDIDNLEARIDEGCGRHFNYWVLADRIQRIPQNLWTEKILRLKDRYAEYYKFGLEKL